MEPEPEYPPPDDTIPPEDDVTRCGAQLRKRKVGRKCRRTFISKNGRCYLHGGLTPKGDENANSARYQGRWSKHLPVELRRRYEHGLQDPELLNLSHEIATLDAITSEVIEAMDSGESAGAWEKAKGLEKEFTKLFEAGYRDKARKKLAELRGVLQAGSRRVEQQRTILSNFERRRKLVETLDKRLQAAQQMIEIGRVYLLFQRFESIVMEYVTDRNIRSVMADRMTREVQGGYLKVGAIDIPSLNGRNG